MIKLKDILTENSTSGLGSGNNSTRWTPPGKERSLNFVQLTGYEQVDFPVAGELDISNEKHNWTQTSHTKRFNNKVRATRTPDGFLVFETEGNMKLKNLLKESKYEVYHDSFTSAAEEVIRVVNKRGFDVDENDWFTSVGSGGGYKRARPSAGKTHRFTVDLLKGGKPTRKKVHFQVFAMDRPSTDGSGKRDVSKYELNMYIQ